MTRFSANNEDANSLGDYESQGKTHLTLRVRCSTRKES